MAWRRGWPLEAQADSRRVTETPRLDAPFDVREMFMRGEFGEEGLVVVDDGTRESLAALRRRLRGGRNRVNRAAVRTALELARAGG